MERLNCYLISYINDSGNATDTSLPPTCSPTKKFMKYLSGNSCALYTCPGTISSSTSTTLTPVSTAVPFTNYCDKQNTVDMRDVTAAMLADINFTRKTTTRWTTK